ncbi:D-aminoacylase, partial [Patescibacteria group bacterium]|nr:D-aminoacylase [Patescibacteria group bacterium]
MASYDVIIRNGTVFDGKGNKPQKIDVGIRNNKIKKIGDLGMERDAEIIDATDKYVCPGFIDLTNHSDTHWTLFSHPRQESLIRQGITTILGGN